MAKQATQQNNSTQTPGIQTPGTQIPTLFEKDAWVDGFTWRTIIGAVFVSLVMMPGAIYMGLITGSGIGGAAEWVVIILFIEIGKRSFIKLGKQEVMILYTAAAGVMASGAALGSGATLFGGPFSQLIWNQYLAQSPQAAGYGIADLLPEWLVPADPNILEARSLFQRAWIIPILLVCIHVLLTYVLMLSMGYFLYRLCNDIERMPYPMAPVQAGGATALAETSTSSESWRWRVFSIGAIIGIAFGFIYGGIPTLTGALTTKAITLLPIPFADATASAGQLAWLPAVMIGISFDLSLVLTGMVLPFRVVVGMFIGSIVCFVLLNPILHHFEILHSWESGMSVIPTSIANSLDFYLNVTIGLAIVIAVIGILAIIRRLWSARGQSGSLGLDEHERKDLEGRGRFPMWAAGLICLATCGAYVYICHLLVPQFPIFILMLFAFVYTPLVSYIAARLIGMVGHHGPGLPYVRETGFLLSGYKGADIWFAPVPLFDMGGVTQTFKSLELTRTKFKSFVKVTVLSGGLMLVFSFVFVSLIWSLGRIPSSTYPYAQKMWPLFATNQSILASSTLASDRLTADSLTRDFSVTPIPSESARSDAPMTPEGEGFGGVLIDQRTSNTKHTLPSQGSPIIVITDPDQPIDPDGLVNHPIQAVLIAVPTSQPGKSLIASIASQHTDYAKSLYWIRASHGDQIVAQLSRHETVSIKRRRNFLLEAINVNYIGASIGVGILMFLGASVMGLGTPIVYGIVAGHILWPHMAIPTFIGALLGRYVIQKRLGKERWRAYVPVLLAGYLCGFGLLLTLCTGIALLAKAVSATTI